MMLRREFRTPQALDAEPTGRMVTAGTKYEGFPNSEAFFGTSCKKNHGVLGSTLGPCLQKPPDEPMYGPEDKTCPSPPRPGTTGVNRDSWTVQPAVKRLTGNISREEVCQAPYIGVLACRPSPRHPHVQHSR